MVTLDMLLIDVNTRNTNKLDTCLKHPPPQIMAEVSLAGGYDLLGLDIQHREGL